MYFRAIIKDQHLMKEFLNTIITLSKLTKDCVMLITSDEIYFIINEESTSIAPMVWTEIQSKIYFDSYNMKGVDDNEYKNILLSINPANFARALSVLRNSINYCKIKLTNNQFPCITVDIELPSSSNVLQNRRIKHDVPIKLIPINDWFMYKIPNIPKPNIILTLPKIRFIRNLIDKIKNLSPSITLYGRNKGELNIVAETESATICSRYRNLEVKLINRDNDNDNNSDNDNECYESSCSIDCKKIAMFLSSLQTINVELNCGILRERLVQMEIEIGLGLIINCIIPAVCV